MDLELTVEVSPPKELLLLIELPLLLELPMMIELLLLEMLLIGLDLEL